MPNTQDQAIQQVAQAFGGSAPEGLTPEQQAAYKQVEQAFSTNAPDGAVNQPTVPEGTISGSAPTGAVKTANGTYAVPGSNKFYSSKPSNSDGAVSSNDVNVGHKQETATTNATNSLAGKSEGMPAFMQPIIQGLQSSDQAQRDLNAKIYKSIGQSYDAQLASTNSMYADSFNRLAQQHTNEVQSANARAIALNPYADSTQSSTASDYVDALNNRYEGAYNALTAKMKGAQMELQAGKVNAYNELAQSAQNEASNFGKEMNNIAMEGYQIQQQQQQQSNFDTTQAYKEKVFKSSTEANAQKQFSSMVNQYSGSQQLQNDIDEYNKNGGEIPPALQPIIDAGKKAGMTADEALQLFSAQSESVRKAQAQQTYEEQRIALAQQKADTAKTNYYNKLAGQIPSPGQVVTASNNTPVKLTDTQSHFFEMGQHLVKQATKVQKLIASLPTGAIRGWVTQNGKFFPVVQDKLDPRQEELLQEMSDLNNMFVYFSTGKQLNAEEFSRLSNQLPNTKATPAYNKTALNNFVSSIKGRMGDYMKVNGWKIYGGSAQPKTSSTTTGGSTLPPSVDKALAGNVTVKGSTATIPRSVWSTFGENMDAVLKAFKDKGYKLVISD